ncbi:MAG: hypothetical protein AAGK92_07730 [Pseudomonadota bacterium]
MLLNLFLGALAGYLTPQAEPHLKKALKDILLEEVPMKEGEFRLFSFIVMMILAAVLTALFGADSSAFLLLFGGGLGVFGQRIYTALTTKKIAPAPREEEDE